MKKLLVLLCFAVAIYSCTPYIYLKHDLVEGDLGVSRIDSVQLFIDRDIVIERVVDTIDKKLTRGTYSTKQGIITYTIKFDDKLPGLAALGSTEEKIIVQLDEKDSECLSFRNFGKDDFYHLVGSNKSGKFMVTYDEFEYEVKNGHDAMLLMKRSDNTKMKKKISKAKGRRL
jgi:hypothetical protein